MNTEVRLAQLADLEALAPLFDAYREFYGQPSDLGAAREFLKERLERRDSVIFIAFVESGVAAGFTQLYPSFSSVSTARTYLLNDLFVAPSTRRAGVGGHLLAAAAEFGRKSGAASLTLSTAVANLRAQRLYEALGWRRNPQFCEYVLPL
jgi:ribosomal protein S18 acetylase RimI-like enzyme